MYTSHMNYKIQRGAKKVQGEPKAWLKNYLKATNL